jgi:nitrate/nitrite transporter NarK
VRAHRAAGSLADVIRCANCWWASLQHAAGFGLGMASGTWITVYLLREFGLPLEMAALLGALLLAFTMAARPVGGYLLSNEHLPTKVVMRLSQLAILAGFAALALPGRPLSAALAGTILVGLGAGLPYAAVFNTAAASARDAPGPAQGLAAVGGTVGALVGAPVIGYAVQTWGFTAAWAILAATSLAALGGSFVMRGEEELA